MKASLQLQPMYCSRDYNYSSRFNQQYEKPTQYKWMLYKAPQTCQSVYPWQNLNRHLAWDDHLQILKSFINSGWPDTKDKLCADLRPYWSYRGKLVVIDSTIHKGRHIVIPNSLKQQVLNQVHTNHMGIEKTKILALESILLVQHKCWYQKLHKALCYMSWISADAAKGKDHPPQHTTQTMRGCWCRCIPFQ